MLTITDDKWGALASALAVEPAVLRAVAEVESGGAGFLATTPTRPKVLFEGHYFHKLTGGRFGTSHPTLSFPRWTRMHYARTGQGEWARLDQAIGLDRTAALQSASWGAFQIMGANYRQCRCDDVEQFVTMQQASADAQLECFTRFIGRDWYLAPLRDRNWATFAERYNGPAYAKNQYDVKLERAYARHAPPQARALGARRPPQAPDKHRRPPGRPTIAAAWSEAVERAWRSRS